MERNKELTQFIEKYPEASFCVAWKAPCNTGHGAKLPLLTAIDAINAGNSIEMKRQYDTHHWLRGIARLADGRVIKQEFEIVENF